MKNIPFQTLEHRLQEPLPGTEAQFRMAHAFRKQVPPPPPDARVASVMALFYPKNKEWNMVFIERVATNPNDRHSGQISFPGGKKDPEDHYPSQTALRETEEEIGVAANSIKLIGELTQLYIPVSNFLVYPFVGKIDYTPTFQPQVEEVADILEVPFEQFYAPNAIQTKDMTVGQGIKLRNVPYFHIQEKVIWGATAMMLSELMEVMPNPRN